MGHATFTWKRSDGREGCTPGVRSDTGSKETGTTASTEGPAAARSWVGMAACCFQL